MNCFVAFSILILDILPNRSCSKVSFRFQILLSIKCLQRDITPHVAYVPLAQFHSFRREIQCDDHAISESFCECVSTFNQLASIYETRNEVEAIENDSLVHLISYSHENMCGGAPPAPPNCIWQDLFEINSRIFKVLFV